MRWLAVLVVLLLTGACTDGSPVEPEDVERPRLREADCTIDQETGRASCRTIYNPVR